MIYKKGMITIFNRKLVDLMLLSIVMENTDGISAYSIVKELKERFDPFWNPSPGTIYPILEKLTISGFIEKVEGKEPPIYKITENGKQKINETVPETLDSSMKFFPMFFQNLVQGLSIPARLDFTYRIPRTFGMCGKCVSPIEDKSFQKSLESENPKRLRTRLEEMKVRLLEAKKEIQEWTSQEIHNIETKIEQIDKKLQKCDEEAKKWVKIKIDNDD